jgi:N-acetylglucosamine kinase-like BadF-type ATPase
MIRLGIDGGGSKTTFLLVDDRDREICRVQSGASNWLSIGKDAAAAAVRQGVGQLTGPKPDAVCGGFAGAGRPEGLEFFKSILEPLFPNSVLRIESDAFIAYAGAIGLEPGVLLIAGTGSIAIGRRTDGTMIRAGGWGPQFGDEGGGFWIGREAVRAALRAFDSGETNDFASRLARKLGLTTIKDVVAAWSDGTVRVPEIAALFPELVSTWPAEPAGRILEAAAAELRALTNSALGRVGVPGCRISAAGSIANHLLMRRLIGINFTDPLASPERGAILLAGQPRRTWS